MKIELRKLSTRKPYPGNPRQNDEAVAAVAGSIQEFGFRQPIVVDANGTIICGHTRWKAAQKLGLEKVPVHVAEDLSPEQIKAYRIADNQTASLAEWDYDLLPIELADLQACNYDLGLLGFDQDELAKLLGGDLQEGLCDPDEVPAPPDEAITSPGDLWVLGNHRLLCGDSSKPGDLDRLLYGATIHLVNTDPPYNVKVEPRSNNAIAAGLSSFAGPKHHQSMDPQEGQADGQEAACQGSTASERLRERRGVRSAAGWVVREHGSRPRAWSWVLYLGRVCELRELPAGVEGDRPLLLSGDHLGEGAPGADAEGLHGQPRVVLLRLARRRRAPVARSDERDRRLEREEGEPAVDGPPDREACRARRTGHAVFIPRRRERARSIRRKRQHTYRR